MAAPAQVRSPNVLWALFGLDGRIGREVFWLSLIFINLVTAALLPPVPAELADQAVTPATLVAAWISLYPLASVVFAIGTWILVALVVKRLHDRGITGWFSLLLLVPFVNLLTFIFVALVPGSPGSNAYGKAPNQRGS